ncbi:hypothetical protein [Streptomyces fuscigenes]|uniref:hypothetical protein n=1 Tax=Streptomyces fuscigenes TaxID=1528880 RepID=UPI001F3A259C|nr:hypothetical protein [Streptomyces fuscigenes]MCF3960400.1 hypothetical protein [Streptomyces fuscigenes]
MSFVRPAVAAALAAPLLLLPAAARGGTARPVATTLSGSAVDGAYYVKDAATGRCLAGDEVATCGSDGTEWSLRNHGDGTVQFQQAAAGSRCLTLPDALTYPADVLLRACDSTVLKDPSPDAAERAALADRWRIEGWADGPVTIAHAYPPTGRLAIRGTAVQVSNNSSSVWVLNPVDK